MIGEREGGRERGREGGRKEGREGGREGDVLHNNCVHEKGLVHYLALFPW